MDGKRSGAVKSADSDASDEDDDLVDPDADRPDFRSLGDEDVDEGDEAEGEPAEAFALAACRARGGHAARNPQKSIDIDPAYVTASVMGVTVPSLALMIWFGRGMLMDLWPGFAGFYDSVGT